jgi:hypothetical protein
MQKLKTNPVIVKKKALRGNINTVSNFLYL